MLPMEVITVFKSSILRAPTSRSGDLLGLGMDNLASQKVLLLMPLEMYMLQIMEIIAFKSLCFRRWQTGLSL